MTAIDYDALKDLAQELGRPLSTLIALSAQNDPFYVRDGRRAQAEWFAGLWDRFNFGRGVHLRRLHYFLISQNPPVEIGDGVAYVNTDDCWKLLNRASRDARYLGLVPADHFVDKRGDDPIVHLIEPEDGYIGCADTDVERDVDIDFPPLPSLVLEPPKISQRYHVEIWIEKTTMNDVLVPLAQRYGLNLIAGAGEITATACFNLIPRAEASGRPVRILYISDFDPAGLSMPVAMARKVEFAIQAAGLDLDIQVRPIALTHDQAAHWRLPRTPIKAGESRAADFEEKYGEGATELDALEALHPGELAKIVTREVRRYYDLDLRDATDEVAREANDQLDEINEAIHGDHQEDIDALQAEWAEIATKIGVWQERAKAVWRGIASDLREAAPAFDDFDWPEPDEGEEDDDPLFDSTRDYVDQIDRYKNHQGRPTERRARKKRPEGAAAEAAS